MRWRILCQELFTAQEITFDFSAPNKTAAIDYALKLDVYVITLKQLIRVKPC
ncbi:hypothetical protein [Pseudoalteromonas fuliginea]|uniref:hypothetical protein n=1 Tax=Pseudoalteromonas fuliginea TaxID=1872678 RepID=UPI00165D35C8|nr:hypothetical protein [Pseudoalteromonas fuliginea]